MFPALILTVVLTVVAHGVSPPARGRAGARSAVGAAERRWGAPPVLATRFTWPVTPPHVVRHFDPPPRPWLPGHRGVDLAGTPSSVVHAAGAGTVVFAGVIAGRGVVSVAHQGGLRTTYEPVAPTVAVGDAAGPGTELGILDAGHPGCAEPACLHWGLRRGDAYLDPLVLLGLGRVRLLPLDRVSAESALSRGSVRRESALSRGSFRRESALLPREHPS